MRALLALMVSSLTVSASPIEDFAKAAESRHGPHGTKAARFLIEHMPDEDRKSLSEEFLIKNLDAAFQARKEFPWARDVPEDLFLNDVLPYAVFDEARDPWREEFLTRARPLVKDAASLTEAALRLNRDFFNLVNVHYNTGRKKPNQSPKESQASGKATCSGLSILLVDVCRSVGIPARAVGTPMWSNGAGNHTWVEIWDNGWHFLGADEHDPNGVNHGWFAKAASEAKEGVPLNAIYATSWKKTGLTFPMVWAEVNQTVPAVDVTRRYAKTSGDKKGISQVEVRLVESKGKERLVATVQVFDESGGLLGEGQTRAGRADLNDMPRFELPKATKGNLRFTLGKEIKEMKFGPLDNDHVVIDAVWRDLQKFEL
jgi:hypothetical protein